MFFQCKVESEASARAVGDGYAASVELDCVFYYGEAEPCTAFLTGASFVNTVEPLKEAGQLFCLDAFAVILESDTTHSFVVFK